MNDKNQAQVVQLLRQAQGMVVLQLARPRSSTTEEDASTSLERNVSSNAEKFLQSLVLLDTSNTKKKSSLLCGSL